MGSKPNGQWRSVTITVVKEPMGWDRYCRGLLWVEPSATGTYSDPSMEPSASQSLCLIITKLTLKSHSSRHNGLILQKKKKGRLRYREGKQLTQVTCQPMGWARNKPQVCVWLWGQGNREGVPSMKEHTRHQPSDNVGGFPSACWGSRPGPSTANCTVSPKLLPSLSFCVH